MASFEGSGPGIHERSNVAGYSHTLIKFMGWYEPHLAPLRFIGKIYIYIYGSCKLETLLLYNYIFIF